MLLLWLLEKVRDGFVAIPWNYGGMGVTGLKKKQKQKLKGVFK